MAMTEIEWLSSTVPRAMLMALESRAKARKIDRKLRLFACACARRVWHLLEDERSFNAIDVAELYADGLSGPEELDAARWAAIKAAGDLWSMDLDACRRDAGVVFGEQARERAWHAAKAAEHVTARKVAISGSTKWYEGGAWVAALTASMCASDAIAEPEELRARDASYEGTVASLSAPLVGSDSITQAEVFRAREAALEEAIKSRGYYQEPWQAELIRCIFGNPFRPVVIDQASITPILRDQARLIYEHRSFDSLAKLANVLEDAGCCDVSVHDHCRRPGVHARGCWVVDEVLGLGSR